ncbi:MAG: SAM-dependent methyltransferase [Cyanobacteria bacterium]|nr:SAM-dependent methyltransferase [Cyanobacteria bacterium GSL.Bin1]
MLLARLFEKQETGFYVDIGAHHPTRFSNTYYFYKLGWRGINIDAMPGSMKFFKKIRPNDINLEIPIYSQPTDLTFYMLDEPALNTFDYNKAVDHEVKNGRVIVEKKTLKTKKLSEILDIYLPKNQTINFMSIDVEGLDYAVLKSNNWERYRPNIILIEALGMVSLEEAMNSEVSIFLQQQGYRLIAKAKNTLFFQEL